MGLSSEVFPEAGSFSRCLNPHRFFSARGFEALFPLLETWVVWSISLSSCFSRFIHPNVGLPTTPAAASPGPPAAIFLAPSSSHNLAVSPLCLAARLHPSYWLDVSSLTPWLSDLHTVRFSVSSGCFLFLNCHCPSFGCARRHSVSTYASILAGSWF